MDIASLHHTVGNILSDIKRQGQKALIDYSQRFDGVDLTELRVSAETIGKARVSDELAKAIEVAANNIRRFHARQRQEVLEVEPVSGVRLWRRSEPISSVGLYIPGGTAPLFSSVLMLGIPAKLAGCKRIILCTPPQADGSVPEAILFAAASIGIDEIYRIGGAQAIGAMAYGSGEVPRVFKIFGPGNQYVTAAKQLVSAEGVAIDMPAGPTEVLILADDSADTVFLAADLLSQAEHGSDSQVVLVTTSKALPERVEAEMKQQLLKLPRREIAEAALQNSRTLVFDTLSEAIEFTNAYAAEHLIINTENAREVSEKITAAGSVFVGPYTPESAGDYASGTNHTLPTGGAAKAYSGVSLESYLTKITFQEITAEGLNDLGPTVEILAQEEQLMGHKNAVSVRLAALRK